MVDNHGINGAMESIPISKFRATCLAVLEEVRRTGKSIQITRFGKPVADIMPPSPNTRSAEWLGLMSNTAEIVGDIVGPIEDSD